MVQSRNTRQKELLEQEVLLVKHLFDAEELYLNVYKKDKKISLATVYRFLKEQKEKGTINEYVCNKRKMYGSEKSHCHFICKQCGKVIHFQINSVDFLKQKELGSIENIQIDVQGICEKCKQQASNNL